MDAKIGACGKHVFGKWRRHVFSKKHRGSDRKVKCNVLRPARDGALFLASYWLEKVDSDLYLTTEDGDCRDLNVAMTIDMTHRKAHNWCACMKLVNSFRPQKERWTNSRDVECGARDSPVRLLTLPRHVGRFIVSSTNSFLHISQCVLPLEVVMICQVCWRACDQEESRGCRSAVKSARFKRPRNLCQLPFRVWTHQLALDR